jgi:hypothetical protein
MPDSNVVHASLADFTSQARALLRTAQQPPVPECFRPRAVRVMASYAAAAALLHQLRRGDQLAEETSTREARLLVTILNHVIAWTPGSQSLLATELLATAVFLISQHVPAIAADAFRSANRMHSEFARAVTFLLNVEVALLSAALSRAGAAA